MLQVSYLIVDLGDLDLEMVTDPFLEAGISIPEELPYQKLPKVDLDLHQHRHKSNSTPMD